MPRIVVPRLLTLLLVLVAAFPAAAGAQPAARHTPIKALREGRQSRALVGTTVSVAGTALGVLHAPDGDQIDVYLQDQTAGVRVRLKPGGDAVEVGDSLQATGVVRRVKGETYVQASSYAVSSGRSPRALLAFTSLHWGLPIASAVFTLLFLGVYWVAARIVRDRERRARVLFEENPEPMLITDTSWRIREVNAAACQLLGYGRELIRMHPVTRLLPAVAEGELAGTLAGLEPGQTFSFETQVEREGKEAADLSVNVRKVDLGGQASFFLVLHDISRQRRDERVFRAFHYRMLQHLPLEVAVMGVQGQYLYVNEKAIPDADLRRKIMGGSDVELCQALGLHPEVALRRRSHRRTAIGSRELVSFEETLTLRDGSTRTFTRVYNPVVEPGGEVSALISYGVETTQLKQYQDQIKEVMEEADRVAEMKDTILANISHEFRTPVTGIIGFAQILQDEVPPDKREFVDIIIRNSRRLMATLNGMVDLSRLNTNFLELNPQVFNLVDEVKQVAQSLANLAKEKKLYLRMRATRPEILVRLDRPYLFRVLENLIGNAVKFTESGGVIVEVSGDTDTVQIRVMDSGIGIRNEFLPFLFEEFNQESAGSMRDFEGAGIGLAVSKRLIDLMEGTLTVDSEKGEGSTFTLSFPAAFHRKDRGDGRPARNRLLVADHSKEVHTLVEYVLSPYFEIEYASDYYTAVQRATETQFDVVLLDADLAETASAGDALASIRDLRGYGAVPIVALDPYAVRGGEVQFLAAGYDAYLHKPIDRKLLLDSVAQVLAPDRKRRHAREKSAR